jgi:hypothetical protein
MPVSIYSNQVKFDYSRNPAMAEEDCVDEAGDVDVFCSAGIDAIRLQVLGGERPNDLRLETVIDPSQCNV